LWEASSGYVGTIQNGPILQTPKEDHRNNCDNNRDRTSLTSTRSSNKGRKSSHTTARQTTTINTTTQMDKRRRDTLKIANNQMTNKTHHVAQQKKANLNQTTHSHHKQEGKEKNKNQHQETCQTEDKNPSQLCNPKTETLTTMAAHVPKNRKHKHKIL
jgi:hypothetical protein